MPQRICSLILALALLGPCAAKTIYVDGANGNDNWTGLCAEWDGQSCGPKKTISAGIAASADGDTVQVADGTYAGAANRALDFAKKAITLRSTKGLTNCTIDCEGQARAFYFHSGETATSVVDGFTLLNGYAHSGSDGDRGGAIFCKSSSPTIRNCVIRKSYAYSTGGGLHGDTSSPKLSDCVFAENSTDGSGGGLYFTGNCSPELSRCTILANFAKSSAGGFRGTSSGTTKLTDCTIAENSANGVGGASVGGTTTLTRCVIANNRNASDDGGGIYCSSGTITLSHCSIIGNACTTTGANSGSGGGIYANGSSITITDSVISGNLAHTDAGGIRLNGVTGSMSNCAIEQNIASEGKGGGISVGASSAFAISNCRINSNVAFRGGGVIGTFALKNCVLHNNAASENGGAIACDASGSSITTCTISQNVAIGSGGGLYFTDGGSGSRSLSISSSIVWANDAAQGRQIAVVRTGDALTLTVGYCDVQGGRSGVYTSGNPTVNWSQGDIDEDPLLTSDGAHVQHGSPCHDAGDPHGSFSGQTDIDGEQRVLGAAVDMGADEYLDTDDDGLPDWWEQAYYGQQDANPDADDDGDGVTNIDEYARARNPHYPPTSYFVDAAGADDWDGLTPQWDGVHGPKATIQAAISAADAREGDDISIADGTYHGVGNRDLDLLGKAVTVRSANGAANCIIDCEQAARGFFIHRRESSDTRIVGLSVRNGITSGATFRYGAGIFCWGASPEISECVLDANVAGSDYPDKGYGGGIAGTDTASPHIMNCQITNNTVGGAGGGVYFRRSRTLIVQCLIKGNSARSAGSDGGGVLSDEGSLIVRECEISGNQAQGRGGGLACWGDATRIEHCKVTSNTARSDGGGVYGPVTIEDCTIDGNSSQADGGGIGYATSVARCTISGNRGYRGGGINCAEFTDSAHIADCLITGNIATLYGGGIDCGDQSLIEGCTVSGNVSSASGGGIYATDPAIIRSCYITRNRTSQSSAGGGGVFCDHISGGGQLLVVNCTVTGNGAQTGGGMLSAAGDLLAANCICIDNLATDGAQLAVRAYGGTSGKLAVSYCDVAGGKAAVYVEPDKKNVLDWGSGNIDAEPLFVRHDGHLRTGSPCIDAGDPSRSYNEQTDIDGEMRVANGRADIGADEFIDTDGDNMPDWWELQYFESNTAGDPGADDDGDGRSNLEEYELRTNPLIAQRKLFVDLNGNDDWDGLAAQWDGVHGPKATIQAGIDAANEFEDDEVVVANGTYRGVGNKDLDLRGKGIALRSAAGPDNCIIDCESSGRGMNIHLGESVETVIDGFTVVNGNHDEHLGAGMLCNATSPTVQNCVLKNHSAFYGAGLAVTNFGNPLLRYCEFRSNSATDGAGVYCAGGGTATISTCLIADNTASHAGGGLRSYSPVRVLDSVFERNVAADYGGGWWSGVVMDRCRVAFNRVNGTGGGGDGDGSSPIRNTLFIGNTAIAGGGFYGEASLENCVFVGNYANAGGACGLSWNSASVANCTLIGNYATTGGGIYADYSKANHELSNSIIWGNFADQGGALAVFSDASVHVAYSDVEGGRTGVFVQSGGTLNWDDSNIDVDPLLVKGDYHLRADSPCVDAGDPNEDYSDQTDADDEPRTANASVDIGADEFHDVDADGLPDFWERQYFGSETVAEPSADPDDDAVTNVAEYEQDTDPLRARATYFVATDGNDAWDGRAPTFDGSHGPKATIQAAIDATSSGNGDGVLVADGTYSGAGNRAIDFKGRDIAVSSMNGPAYCRIDCAQSSRAFQFVSGEPTTALLDGFTIANGKETSGGAILCAGGSPLIANCVFDTNQATGSSSTGGAIAVQKSSHPRIQDCLFMRNTAANGGALWTEIGQPPLEHCTLQRNSAQKGGAVYGPLSLSRCLLIGNIANSSSGGGGALYATASNRVSATWMEGNTSFAAGGAILCSPASVNNAQPALVNSLFIDNFASTDAGAVLASNQTKLLVANCTFGINRAAATGGTLLSASKSAVDFVNCISCGNAAPVGSELAVSGSGSALTARYSDIAGGKNGVYVGSGTTLTWGTGNIDTSPEFALFGDWHISGGSPCRDTGTNDLVNTVGPSDFDGAARLRDGNGDGTSQLDMGAYEFDPTVARLVASRRSVSTLAFDDEDNPRRTTLVLRRIGIGSLHWRIESSVEWLVARPATGEIADEDVAIDVQFQTDDLTAGVYAAVLTVRVDGGDADELAIPVDLRIAHALRVPASYSTIQKAINAAKSGDAILVADGTYTGTGNRDLTFNGKDLILASENGAGACIIDCEKKSRGITFNRSETSQSVLEGFTIRNGTGDSGAGARCSGASPILRNCIFAGNAATADGGAVYISSSARPQLVNCLLYGNTAEKHGGAVAVSSATPQFAGCTLTANTAKSSTDGAGGGLYLSSGARTLIAESILWQNSALNGSQIAATGSGSAVSVIYCDVQDGQEGVKLLQNATLYWSTNNIATDPSFVDAEQNNFRLGGNSDCIDAGDPDRPHAGEFDIDEQPRVIAGRIDLGADEYTSRVSAPADLNCDGEVSFSDIDAFVLCLTSPTAYMQQYPECDWMLADINSDGAVDFDDIDGFVDCLINNGCP